MVNLALYGGKPVISNNRPLPSVFPRIIPHILGKQPPIISIYPYDNTPLENLSAMKRESKKIKFFVDEWQNL